MFKKIIAIPFLLVILIAGACSKEEFVNVLQTSYAPTVKEAETTTEDFTVSLNARALQNGERGEWKIVEGTVKDNFVVFENKANPFSKFKGLPGEKYTLEWTRFATDGTSSAVQLKVQIPDLVIEISDNTPPTFQTIRTLSVNPKYRGTWSIAESYAILDSKYFDGRAESPEKKPSIELHGYANKSYTATYKYTYAGKEYQFSKTIQTGNYTEDEGLYLLQLQRGNSRITQDLAGHVLELNLQASGIAWIMGRPQTYPALGAFKKLRKLILGGSSLSEISTLFGDNYLELEELSMDMMGNSTTFPDNFGNMTKLKTLLFRPANSVSLANEITLPKSFANLTALESCSILNSGYVNFNGTLGKLKSLQVLNTNLTTLTEDIGDLKALEHVELYCRSSVFPQRFAECTSLVFARITFDSNSTGDIVLSSKMGDLKKLQTLQLTTSRIRSLPESFVQMSSLKVLSITSTSMASLPENIGALANLEDVTLYGNFDKIPNSIGNLSKLAYLVIGGRPETLPESFGNLISLKYFNAQSTLLKSLPASIGKLKNLKELSLQQTKLEGLPQSFSALDALETLNLASTSLKSFPLEVIPLKSIRTITFNNCNLGLIPDQISAMKPYVAFYMYGVPSLTNDHLKYITSITKDKSFYTNLGYYSS
jgi:Leucine-rich repeat (LRR) protein